MADDIFIRTGCAYATQFRQHQMLELSKLGAESLGIATGGKDLDVIISEVFEETVEDALHGPIFVIDYPAAICPLR